MDQSRERVGKAFPTFCFDVPIIRFDFDFDFHQKHRKRSFHGEWHGFQRQQKRMGRKEGWISEDEGGSGD